MQTLSFYQIDNPTTKQIFDAIISNQYVPLEKLQSKAKQIKVLLLDYWNCSEIFITFDSMTNTGGVPIFFGSNDSIYDIASEQSDWYNMTEQEQEETIELMSCYMTTYNSIFNL